jgi:hypothetical protein
MKDILLANAILLGVSMSGSFIYHIFFPLSLKEWYIISWFGWAASVIFADCCYSLFYKEKQNYENFLNDNLQL